MKAHINPVVLRWAREEAQLSLEEAAHKGGLSDTRKETAVGRLESWETGDTIPTRKQIASLAKAYYRPILTFYLREPPAQGEQVPDFRTIGDRPMDLRNNILSALLRRMRARQREVVELLTDDNDDLVPLPFIGRFRQNASPEDIANDIRQVLDLPFQVQRRMKGQVSLFRFLWTQAEDVGVFVLLQGNLGSYHTDIEPEDFRGIALPDPVAPFVIINGNDAKAAHTFTLLHELAHLWLGEAGISNLSPFAGEAEKRGLEAYCNKVASEFLLPTGPILEAWGRMARHDLLGSVETLANQFNVSRAAVANRLWKLGRVGADDWWALYRTYQDEWRQRRERQREQDGGPGYYITKRSQLGSALIKTVLGAIDAGNITYTRASRILGVNAKSFDGLRAGAG